MRKTLLVAALIMLLVSSAHAQTLLTGSNLTYVGAFKLTQATSTAAPYGFGQNGGFFPTYNPTSGNWFFADINDCGYGVPNGAYVAEVTPPALYIGSSYNVSNLSAANFASTNPGGFYNIIDGMWKATGAGNTTGCASGQTHTGGLFVNGSTLLATILDEYSASDCDVLGTYTHGTTLSGSTFAGLYGFSISGLANYVTYASISGYFAAIPTNYNYQQQLCNSTGSCTATVISGATTTSINENTSYGPSALAWNPANLTSPGTAGANSGTPLVMYPPSFGGSQRWTLTANTPNTTQYWSDADNIQGAVLPVGTSTLLFFGNHYTGTSNGQQYCYGYATTIAAEQCWAQNQGPWSCPSGYGCSACTSGSSCQGKGSAMGSDIASDSCCFSAVPSANKGQVISGPAYQTVWFYDVGQSNGNNTPGNSPSNSMCIGAGAPFPECTGVGTGTVTSATYNNLTAVVKGLTAFYNVAPYTMMNLPFHFDTSNGTKHGGAGYNPSTQQIYVSIPGVDTNYGPAIEVYQVSSGGTNYTVTGAVSGGNGTISPTSQSILSGSPATLTLSPNSGYTGSMSSDTCGAGGALVGVTYTTAAITGPCTVTASFASSGGTQYAITASTSGQSGGGSISPSGTVNLNSGSNQTFTLTANATYHIADVVVDGTTHLGPQSSPYSYTFSNVTAAHTITAMYGRVVNVSSVAALVSAISVQQAGDEIAIAPGAYPVASVSGGPGTYGYIISANNLLIHGVTGNRDDVTILGDFFTNGTYNSGGTVNQVFAFAAGSNGLYTTIKDMTIGQVGWSAIMMNGGGAANYSLFSNLRVIDCYQQFIKGNLSTTGTSGVTVQNCLIEFTAANHLAPNYYTGGIDIHAAVNCTIQDNILRYFQSPDGTNLPDPAVHLWDDPGDGVSCTGNLVQRNLIIDCDRGIGFWNDGVAANAGTIRNNMIYNASIGTRQDAPIYIEYCPGTQIYNNTVYTVSTGSSYPNSIEYRYSSTTGVLIENNLLNQAIVARDSATGTVSNNNTSAVTGWFVNRAVGDLHLASAVLGVFASGGSIAGLTDDFDQQTRTGSIDIGADQYSSVSGTWYKVTPTIGSNGTAIPFLQKAVLSGGTTAFTAIPSSGYSITWGGTCGGSAAADSYSIDSVYTTNAVTANCTVTATFSLPSTHPPGISGGVSISGGGVSIK